jgi:hypothetical protein
MGMGTDMQQVGVISDFTSKHFHFPWYAAVEAHDSNSWH